MTETEMDSDITAIAFALVIAPPVMRIIAVSGAITWTPGEAQGPGTNPFRVGVTDNGVPALSATNSFTVIVTEVNSAPVLTVPANQMFAELTTLNVSASATDSDIPSNTLSFALVSAPLGMSINPVSGAITWTPGEAQGPGTNLVSVSVTDNGVPALSATNSFTVIVTEVNRAPVLSVPANQTLAEVTTLNVSASATDRDIPSTTSLLAALPISLGMSINPVSGAITWTPGEAQGPGTNLVSVSVTDNGVPALSATNSFTVIVTEVNSAPVLTLQSNRTMAELTMLEVTNRAMDSDVP